MRSGLLDGPRRCTGVAACSGGGGTAEPGSRAVVTLSEEAEHALATGLGALLIVTTESEAAVPYEPNEPVNAPCMQRYAFRTRRLLEDTGGFG